MRMATIGSLRVSGLCLGGNPFSGFSHQTPIRDVEMKAYYTPDRIKAVWRAAEQAGINAFFGRTDQHIIGLIKDYWQAGGTIQWFAQVCQDEKQPDSWKQWLDIAAKINASALYLHGGVVDCWYVNRQFANFHEALQRIRDYGKTAGFAGHMPEAHAWIRDHLDVDFQMCCHYNPTDRSRSPHHISSGEKWNEEDRRRMLDVIKTILKPVVHFKVFAGGNAPIRPAFELLGRVMRPRLNDVVNVGMFIKDDPVMIAKNVALFEHYVQ